ncbi:hypothetical protein PHPALM_28383 [Phytophthora palmivora]|uniref:Uncharacterized protein n=1 Tax=Phytophthora palmivora TaxID=4796 RepID=A0A2P4XA81_9STRA|nr:hypothetical protein PHPALM_28383 [Phytophthora palmivora]
MPPTSYFGFEKKCTCIRSRNAPNAATMWINQEQDAYNETLALVRDSVLTASPNTEAELMPSITDYSIVVTQVVDWDPSLPIAQHKHEIIICKGDAFKHNELNWTIVERRHHPSFHSLWILIHFAQNIIISQLIKPITNDRDLIELAERLNVYLNDIFESTPTKHEVGKYNPKQFKGTYGDYCGVWCMLWLYCKPKTKMSLLNRFKDLNLTILI